MGGGGLTRTFDIIPIETPFPMHTSHLMSYLFYVIYHYRLLHRLKESLERYECSLTISSSLS